VIIADENLRGNWQQEGRKPREISMTSISRSFSKKRGGEGRGQIWGIKERG